MNRRTVLAQLVVIAVIAVLVIGYAVFELLGVRVTNKPYEVKVHLATAGGIFEGAEVAYRGVEVGRVRTVDLQTDGVMITLAIDHGTKIPDNAVANIFDLSAVGEQYVDLVPTAASPHLLHGGSVIPVERTTTPLQTATVLYDLERFVNSIDPKDVSIIGREGAAAFGGTGPQLKSLLADATTIVRQLSSTEGATIDLIHHSATLLQGLAAHTGDFDEFATALNGLSTTLAAKASTIDAFLKAAGPTTTLLNTLIAQNGSAITVLLGNLATLSDIQVARVPGLKSLLVAVPEFGRRIPAVVHDGALLGAGDTNQSQALCPTGVALSNPLSGKRTAVQSVACTLDILQRGADNAPRPTGSGAAPASASQRQLAAYDTSTGLTTTDDGTSVRLGTNGGQSGLLGVNSWQSLLLAVTGG